MIFNMQLSEDASLAELSDIRVGVDGTVYPSAGDAVRGQITDVKEDLDNFKDGYSLINLFLESDFLGNDSININSQGKVVVGAGSDYVSYLVPVDGVSTYSFTFCRLACLVDADKVTAIGSLLSNVTQITSTGASYIAFSFKPAQYPTSTYQVRNTSETGTETVYKFPLWLGYYNTPHYFTRYAASISNGGQGVKLTECKTRLRKGERIAFTANITSFGALRIGMSTDNDTTVAANQKNFFIIDSSNVSYYADSTATPVVEAHGLTISNNISVITEYLSTAQCKIIVISNGVAFNHTFTYAKQALSFPFARITGAGSVLANCKLTWSCSDINRGVWMFGDSYMTLSPARWAYWLYYYGGIDKNVLIDAYPGADGESGRIAFNNLLQYGTPKMALWALGMNDGSDSSSAPSASWVTARDYFITYCETYNILPIFGTIPTVPTINHEQKNAWIRSSGYRYIDFAAAVGAQSDGTWFNGMLSQDGVHPTENGARALFGRALVDMPELTIDDFNAKY